MAEFLANNPTSLFDLVMIIYVLLAVALLLGCVYLVLLIIKNIKSLKK